MDTSLTEQVCDLVIGAAYFSIPALLLFVLYHRPDFPLGVRRMLSMFTAFIFLCGLTHVVHTFERQTSWTHYLMQVVKIITMLISALTSVVLWYALPHILEFPSPTQLQALNEELQRNRDKLSDTVDKRTQELLREKARWQVICERSPQILWLSKASEFVVEFCNHKFFTYTGLSNSDNFLSVVHPADVPGFLSTVQSAKRNGVGYTHKCRLRRKDGEYRWHQINSDPLRDPQTGAIIQWCGISSDVHDVEIMVQMSSEEASRKSRFLSTISHEMRTPLNGILGVATLLSDSSLLTPKQYDHINNITRCADQLLTIINNILDLSTLQSRKMSLNVERMSINDCIEDAIKLVGSQAYNKNITVVNTVPAFPAIDIDGDYARVCQVLTNLLSNSVKFSSVGANVEVAAELVVDENSINKLRISVKDTGIGISQEDMPKIFEMFSQLDSSSTRKFGGTGLGLAICKELVTLMRGDIWCQSTLGQETIFSFTIDLNGSASRRIPISLSDSSIPRGSSVESSPRTPYTTPAPLSPNLNLSPTILRRSPSSNGYSPTKCIPPLSLQGGAKPHDPQPLIRVPSDNSPIPMVVFRRLSASSSSSTISLSSSGPLSSSVSSSRVSSKNCTPIPSPSPIPKLLQASDEISSPIHSQNLSDSSIPNLTRYASDCSFFAKPRSLSSSSDSMNDNTIPLLRNTHSRILIVDDNVLNLKVLKNFLKGLGYLNIDVATDGLQALKMACGCIDVNAEGEHEAQGVYDIIFMDMQMPVMDGVTAATAIRAHTDVDHQPHIISVTANACEEDLEKCRDAGMCVHLAKPVKKDNVRELMDEFLMYISAGLKYCPCNNHRTT